MKMAYRPRSCCAVAGALICAFVVCLETGQPAAFAAVASEAQIAAPGSASFSVLATVHRRILLRRMTSPHSLTA